MQGLPTLAIILSCLMAVPTLGQQSEEKQERKAYRDSLRTAIQDSINQARPWPYLDEPMDTILPWMMGGNLNNLIWNLDRWQDDPIFSVTLKRHLGKRNRWMRFRGLYQALRTDFSDYPEREVVWDPNRRDTTSTGVYAARDHSVFSLYAGRERHWNMGRFYWFQGCDVFFQHLRYQGFSHVAIVDGAIVRDSKSIPATAKVRVFDSHRRTDAYRVGIMPMAGFGGRLSERWWVSFEVNLEISWEFGNQPVYNNETKRLEPRRGEELNLVFEMPRQEWGVYYRF